MHPRDLAEGLDMIKVFYGDETIPSLYENSRVSQEQLPGQPGSYYFFEILTMKYFYTLGVLRLAIVGVRKLPSVRVCPWPFTLMLRLS